MRPIALSWYISLFLVSACLIPTAGEAAYAYTGNHGLKNFGATASGTTTPTWTATSGCLIVVELQWAGSSVTSVTDTLGNTYQAATTVLEDIGYSSRRNQIWYAQNITGGAGFAATVTLSGSSGTSVSFILAAEFCGSATPALDVVNNGQRQINPGGSVDAVTSGAATTTQAGDLIIGFTTSQDTSNVWTAGTGYTKLDDMTFSSAVWGITEYQIQASAGSIAATATIGTSISTTRTLAQVATFKAGGAPPPPVSSPQRLLMGVGQ